MRFAVQMQEDKRFVISNNKTGLFMEKTIYVAPKVEQIRVKVEANFMSEVTTSAKSMNVWSSELDWD